MNLPNKLTVVRLIVIPFFLILMVIPFHWGAGLGHDDYYLA